MMKRRYKIVYRVKLPNGEDFQTFTTNISKHPFENWGQRIRDFVFRNHGLKSEWDITILELTKIY